MSYRLQKFPQIINMIEKYEYKFKKQMTIEVLRMYIQEALQVSRDTAREYILELKRMEYIEIKDLKVLRGVNA